MKKLFVTMFLLISISICYGQEDAFFKNYPAENKYNGKIVLPEGYRKEEGLIFNDINKAVELTINYNGKYAIVRNSCGTGCMYLTLVDVSNGKVDENIFADYNINEITAMEINGERYISIPLSKKESRGIIMKYKPADSADETCYEQKFIIENRKLKALSDITSGECI